MVSLWLAAYAATFVALDITHSPGKKTLKDLLPIALALPTAFLAAAFNRRHSYLQALRDLWKSLIPAVQRAIQYTHISAPDQAAYALVLTDLSGAIDSTRGVFENIPGARRGLYPYENLKDIRDITSWLGFGDNFRKAEAPKARQCITALWQEMFHAMLLEFDRDVPARPVSKFLYDGISLADLITSNELNDDDLDPKKRHPASHPRSPNA